MINTVEKGFDNYRVAVEEYLQYINAEPLNLRSSGDQHRKWRKEVERRGSELAAMVRVLELTVEEQQFCLKREA